MIKKLKQDLISAKKANDWKKCIDICRTALDETEDLDWSVRYALKLTLALALIEEKDQNDQNLTEAINIYKEILNEATSYSHEWAQAHGNLGYVYSINRKGDKNQNLLKTIEHYENSLHVIKQAKQPLQWASIHAGLGHAYMALKKDKNSGNLKLAISHFKEALTVFNQEKYPEEWQEISDALNEIVQEK